MLDNLSLRGIDLSGDENINFKDFAVLADRFFEEDLWP